MGSNDSIRSTADDTEPRKTDPTHRTYVSYIDKSREYYSALGYERAYRWATNAEVPFAPLTKPLADSVVGVVTTSSLHRSERSPGDPPVSKEAFASSVADAPEAMFTKDLFWDKQATHTDDRETYLPLNRLAHFVDEGRIGSVADRFYGVPTEYSRSKTARHSSEIEKWCREDDVDVAILIPL